MERLSKHKQTTQLQHFSNKILSTCSCVMHSAFKFLPTWHFNSTTFWINFTFKWNVNQSLVVFNSQNCSKLPDVVLVHSLRGWKWVTWPTRRLRTTRNTDITHAQTLNRFVSCTCCHPRCSDEITTFSPPYRKMNFSFSRHIFPSAHWSFTYQ